MSTHDGVVRSQPGVPDPGALSREYLEGYLVLPLAIADGRLRVAVAGTPDPQALDDLARLFDAIPEVVAVEEERLRDAIRRALDQSPSVLELVDAPDNGLERDETGQELLADARDLATQPPVVRYVNLLLRDAYGAGASDVHLESAPDGLRARWRVDGVLARWAPRRGARGRARLRRSGARAGARGRSRAIKTTAIRGTRRW